MKKMIALVLALIMTLSLLPTTVWALEDYSSSSYRGESGIFVFTDLTDKVLSCTESVTQDGNKISIPCGTSAPEFVYLAVGPNDGLEVDTVPQSNPLGEWKRNDTEVFSVYKVAAPTSADEWTVARTWNNNGNQRAEITIIFDFDSPQDDDQPGTETADPFAGFDGEAKEFIDEYLTYDANVSVWIKGANLWVESENATTYQYLGINSWNAANDCLIAYGKLSDAEKEVLGSVVFPSGTVSYILGIYQETLGNDIKYFYSFDDVKAYADSIEFTEAGNAAAAWLDEYITYDSTAGEFWFKSAGAIENGYPVNQTDHTVIKNACDTYNNLPDDTKFLIDLLYLSEGTIGYFVSECSAIVQLPYYTLLDGLTEKDAIEFVETYVVCRAYGNRYMTELSGAWQYDKEADQNVYNPTTAKAALDAYAALSDDAKKELASQVLKQGDPTNPNDYGTPPFAMWMQKQQADYIFQTASGAGTLLDPNAMTDVPARDFFEDFFDGEIVTYEEDNVECDILEFWLTNVEVAPDGGYMTQEGYDRAKKMLETYAALSDDSKRELDKLCVDPYGYSSFGWRIIERYGSLKMAAATGTAKPGILSTNALNFLAEAGLSLTADGALSITDVKMVNVDGQDLFWIDYSKTNKDDGLANMNAAKKPLTAWFGTEFDKTCGFSPIWERAGGLYDELNKLEITVNGKPMWFAKAMEYFQQVWYTQQHTGYYQDYLFQAVGYTALPLGTEEDANEGLKDGFFYVDVVDGLVEGVDYTYEYTYNGTTYIFDDAEKADPRTAENEDPSMQGILTIRVKAGEKDHWKKAFENTPKVHRNAGVLFSVRIVSPAQSERFTEVCGNGIDGVFKKYLNYETEPYKTELYNSSENGRNCGNGRPIAAINQVGEVVTITPSGHYASDHMLTVWYDGQYKPVALNMIRFRVIVEDEFSYEFNTPVEYAEAKSVTFNDTDKWEKVKNEPGELIVRPKDGTIKGTLNAGTPFDGEDYVFGSFTLTPPKAGYTLDIDESNNLTQGGNLWIKDGTDTTSNVTLNLYADSYNGGRNCVTFYTFVWKNDATGDVIEETLTVRVTERQSYFADMTNGTVSAQPVSEDDVDDAQDLLGLAKVYDEALGFLDVTFDEDELPSVDVAKALYNRAGVNITPPAGATHFRNTMGDGNQDLAYINIAEADELVAGLREADLRPLYRSTGTLTPDAQYQLVFPYAAIDPMVLGDLTIYFAYTQNYRWQAYEWLKEDGVDANGNPIFTTVGYTYIYGKNSSLVQTETTASVEDEKDLPVNEDGQLEKPIIIGEGMNLVANRYIQEGGGGKHWYLRLSVDEESNLDEVNGNWVYLPYEYVGLTWEEAQELRDAGYNPTIYHYAQGENMEPERIEGKYLPQGIRFNVNSFSPFVIDVSATEGNKGDNTEDNTSGYPGYYYPVVTPDKDTVEKPTETKPTTPAQPVTPPAQETVTPVPEDTTPVVPDEPVTDEPVVDEAPAVDTEPANSAGLWIGVGIVALAAIVVVLAVMAVRKKRKD